MSKISPVWYGRRQDDFQGYARAFWWGAFLKRMHIPSFVCTYRPFSSYMGTSINSIVIFGAPMEKLQYFVQIFRILNKIRRF